MSILFTLLSRSPYFDLPQSLAGRLSFALGWLLYLSLVCLLLWRSRGYQKKLGRQDWFVLLGLGLLVPVTSLFLGVRLPESSFLSPPNLPVEPRAPSVMVFAALPWVLAAGLLGPFPSAGLAALSGLLLGMWDTHSLFTPLDLALLAVLFSSAVHQRFRTRVYRLLRHPLAATLLLTALYPLVALIGNVLSTDGALASRLDYALSQVGATAPWIGIPLLVAGLFAEVLALVLPARWGTNTPLQPSPAERSLEARFLYGMAPLAALLVLALMIGDWYVAGSAARRLLRDRLENTALTVAQGVPFFLEEGQNLIKLLVEDPRLASTDPSDLPGCSEDIRRVPYFNQLFVLDAAGTPSGYPLQVMMASRRLRRANGYSAGSEWGAFQVYTVPSAEGIDRPGVFHRLCSGRGRPAEPCAGGAADRPQPFTQPVITSLHSLEAEGGEGSSWMRMVAFSTIRPTQIMTTYSGSGRPCGLLR
jgi:hypothetical protein